MKRGILALTVTVVAATSGQAQAASGLVGHWRFDESSGLTVVDSSGLSNTGTLAGDAQRIAGKRGPGALHFGADGGSVRVPAASVLEPASGVTVQAWVRRTGTPGNFRYVVSKGASACLAASYGLYTGPTGGLRFYASSAAGFDYTLSPDAGAGVWDGSWHLATGTYDGTSIRLYVDGSEVGSGVARAAGIGYGLPDTNDLFTGRYAGCGGLDYVGDTDEVKVFGRALTAAEVAAEFRYAFRGFFSPVNNAPTVNVAKAGSAIPVKFSLDGFQGLGIIIAGSPSSQRVNCSTSSPIDAIEETATAGMSSLSYDAAQDQYSYVWKTEKAWSASCRQLVVTLDDGSVHAANFSFTK